MAQSLLKKYKILNLFGFYKPLNYSDLQFLEEIFLNSDFKEFVEQKYNINNISYNDGSTKIWNYNRNTKNLWINYDVVVIKLMEYGHNETVILDSCKHFFEHRFKDESLIVDDVFHQKS